MRKRRRHTCISHCGIYRVKLLTIEALQQSISLLCQDRKLTVSYALVKGLYKESMAPLRAGAIHTILCLLLITHISDGEEFVSSIGDFLKLLVRQSTGEVVVSSNTTLYTLSAGLAVQQSISYGGHFRLLAQSDIGHLMWCDSVQCNLTGPTTSISFPSTTVNGNQIAANSFLQYDTTVASATILPTSDQSLTYVHKCEIHPNSRMLLTIGNITTANSTYTLSGKHDERIFSGFTRRTIVSTIRTDEYFYYVINHVQSQDDFNVRLVRICANDTGITVNPAFFVVDTFDSYYELKLQCGNNPTQASSATYYNGAGGPHIIVSFTEHDDDDADSPTDHNIACAYKESTISSLITDKFTECSEGEGMSGLPFSDQPQTDCVQVAEDVVPNECKLGKDSQHSLELDDAYTGNVVLNSSSRIVSMLSFNNFGSVSVFTASDDNQVHKYVVTADSTSLQSLRESFNVTVGPVTSLAASPNGSLLYVLTPNKVISYSSEQCSQYSNCYQCLDQVDPVCGWCLLDSKCSTQGSCSGQFWTPSNGMSGNEHCPRGNIMDDIIISTEGVPYNVTVRVDNLPMDQFDCVFTTGTTSVSSQAMGGGSDTVTCTLDNVPAALFTDNDTTVLTLSLRHRDSSQSFLNVTGNITVFDCTGYEKCSGCLTSRHDCAWCPNNAHCTATQTCTPNVTTADQCPQLTTSTSPYTLHMSVNEQLVINGRNFIRSGGNNYYCVVTYGGVSLSVTASWDPEEMTITCGQRSFSFAGTARQSTAIADLEVIWTTPNNINYTIDEPSTGVQVTLYQCHLLGPHCTSCLAHNQMETNFDCVFCPSPGLGCVFNSSCSSTPFTTCPSPMIHWFRPASGPTNGGTMISINGSNLGMRFEDIKSIMIGGAHCDLHESSYVVGRRINCTTTTMDGPHSNNIIIVTDNGNHTSTEQFFYKTVRLGNVSPARGPVSGGTVINITGDNLDIGNTQAVLVADKQCMIENVSSEFITCKTPESTEGVATIMVEVDSFTGTTRNNFEYFGDPVFTDITPKNCFTSGGTEFKVFGEGLDVVHSPRILFTISSSRKRQTEMEYDAPCEAINATLLSCDAPQLPKDIYGSADQRVTLGLVMDGVTELLVLNQTIAVYTDPVFFPLTKDNSSLVFEEGEYSVINITGNMFRFEQNQLMVLINNISTCRVIQKSSDSVECIPVDTNYPVNTDIPITVKLGNQMTTIGNIKFVEEEGTSMIVVVIAVVVSVCIFILLVTIFVVILGCVWRNSRRKDQKLDELQMTLSKLETNVAHECKEAFTQLLTDLDEYTGDLTNVSLPYFNFQNYMVKTVLSGLEDTLQSSKLRNNQLPQLRKRLEEFHHLMMDRRFLLIVIKTMEEQRDFSIREKCQMGNLLTIILHTRLDYLTQIMKMSLSDLIRRSVAKDNYRVLLRRTDSVAERILSNWLALCLHQHILDQVGQPLYTLFRAIKGQLEKGPVDVVTGDARYSLSEQRIIRQQMAEVPEIIVSIIVEEGNLRAAIKLLQCDTISQAKEKIFDHLYKSQSVSSRPYTFYNSDLYMIQASGRITILRDFDYTTEEDGEWKRVNTLEHYEVHKERSPVFKLVKRNSYTSGVADFPATLVTTPNAQLKPQENEEGQKYWHLFKHVDVDDPKISPLLSKKLVTEVFFPRILYTKKVMQSFVDDLFNSLFSLDHVPQTPYANTRQFQFTNGNIPSPLNYARGADSVPMAVKYLFDYLDYEAHCVGMTDPDVVHVWKNNSLSLRFWVNLIKNPEFVFDINKSLTMDSCLSIVAQAFIDGCSLSDAKLNKDSPTGKLLYNKDVTGYKQKVRRYYDDIRRLPPISEEAMISYLKALSNYQAHQLLVHDYPFSMHSALYQLLKLTARHSHKILENLREKGLDTPAIRYESILHEILTEV